MKGVPIPYGVQSTCVSLQRSLCAQKGRSWPCSPTSFLDKGCWVVLQEVATLESPQHSRHPESQCDTGCRHHRRGPRSEDSGRREKSKWNTCLASLLLDAWYWEFFLQFMKKLLLLFHVLYPRKRTCSTGRKDFYWWKKVRKSHGSLGVPWLTFISAWNWFPAMHFQKLDFIWSCTSKIILTAMGRNELAILCHGESCTYEKDQNAPIWEVKALWSQSENICGRGNEARGWILGGLKGTFCVSPGNVIHSLPQEWIK